MGKEGKSSWKKETARDFIALGGIAFYFIVIGRALISDYYDFVLQLAISAVLLFILSLLYKRADYHAARSLVLVVFTIIFYNFFLFSAFAVILMFGIVFCAFYLERDIKNIIYGLILGAVSSIIAFYLVRILI